MNSITRSITFINKSYNLNTTKMPNNNEKKKGYNTDVSGGTKKFQKVL